MGFWRQWAAHGRGDGSQPGGGGGGVAQLWTDSGGRGVKCCGARRRECWGGEATSV